MQLIREYAISFRRMMKNKNVMPFCEPLRVGCLLYLKPPRRQSLDPVTSPRRTNGLASKPSKPNARLSELKRKRPRKCTIPRRGVSLKCCLIKLSGCGSCSQWLGVFPCKGTREMPDIVMLDEIMQLVLLLRAPDHGIVGAHWKGTQQHQGGRRCSLPHLVQPFCRGGRA